jgi:hypothetical protein
MIRVSKYTVLLLVILSGAFASCKKEFLELNSPTSLTPQLALAAETDLLVALRGAYASFRAVDYYGRTVPVLGDIVADNTYQSVQNTNRYTLFNNYSFNVTDLNVAGLWSLAYNSILRTNNIINSPIASSANVNQYKGEAYALRAMSYFTLIRYFARPYTDSPGGLGVPIVTVYDPDLKPARNTTAEVYTLILADLAQAFNLMGTTFTNSSQFSKYVARALQAKVYLTMGDKTNAKTAAIDVITNGGFVPVTAAGYVAYWQNPAISTTKGETLYEVSSDAVNNAGFDALPYIYTQGGNYGDLLVSSDLIPAVIFSPAPSGGTTATGRVNINAAGNVTGVTITNAGSGYNTSAPVVTFAGPPAPADITATGTAVLAGGTVTTVTITNPGSGYKELLPITDVRRGLYPTGPRPQGVPCVFVEKYPSILSDRSDTKILRLSEMYLIAAEASLPSNEADALTYVNFITSRRGATAISSTGAQLFEDIITERRKELAFEGDRYMDLQRLKRNVVRSTNYPAAALSIPYSDFRRVLPIPQGELNANPNIRSQQNPGY